jgi:hypothetical protein
MTWGAARRSAEEDALLAASVDYCGRFFLGEAEVQKALVKLVAILETEDLPYAVIGALALNQYGHRRVTVDVDLVMRDEDLDAFKRAHLGKGYAERVAGTGKLIDTEFGVNVDVLSTGQPPIAFPDPRTTAVRGQTFALLPVERWIELKLASGMVRSDRLKDLACRSSFARRRCLARRRTSSTRGCARNSSSGPP